MGERLNYKHQSFLDFIYSTYPIENVGINVIDKEFKPPSLFPPKSVLFYSRKREGYITPNQEHMKGI